MDEAFKRRRARIGALTLVLVGLFALIAFRLVIVVVVDGPRLVALGRNEHSSQMELAAVRGPILDRNGKPLALSAETRSIFAHPHTLRATSSPADRERLAAALGLTAAELEARLAHGVSFVWLARHLAPSRASEIERFGLKGLGGVNEYKRFYPESNLAAAVVGMAGMDGQGLSGVELQYDKLVRGEPMELHFYQDALGRPILDSPLQSADPKAGARLELTIDSSIQAEAERYLAKQVAESGASRGTALMVDPFSGEVLALANVGGDPSGAVSRLHNVALQDSFEPGSTIKGILGAIALEDHVIDPSRQIFCEQGQWSVGGGIIHDDGRYGWLTLGDIIEVSSNIGAAKLAMALGRRRLYEGMSAFGLGSKTGIDLPGEASGLVRQPSSWSPLDLANHAFGQGLAVTPIQLVMAYAAIANGGVMMRPYVVKAAHDPTGHEVLLHTPQVLRRSVTPAVAHAMNQILRGVVTGRDGTGHLARVVNFTVAGKTGTAQTVNPATGTYYRDRLVASFVGFVPAEDPKLVILVVLYDVPHGHFGGLVAAPVFSEIASGALQRIAARSVQPAVESASLLPTINLLSLFPPTADDDSGVPNDDLGPRVAERDRQDSTNGELGENNLGRIPDFRGLSLRSAFALARNSDLALNVKGDGYVVSQEPGPGLLPETKRLLNPVTPTNSVEIVLAAPDTITPQEQLPLEGAIRVGALIRGPGKSYSLASVHLHSDAGRLVRSSSLKMEQKKQRRWHDQSKRHLALHDET